MTEPQTTLPYIHCPHCGVLIIGVVKSDKSSDKVMDIMGAPMPHRSSDLE